MKDFSIDLPGIMARAAEADVSPLRQFLFDNPAQPLVATGSGGAESVADFAALLYGARGGIATAVSPYTLNSFSDAALRTSKLLLVSAGGHNNDIAFAWPSTRGRPPVSPSAGETGTSCAPSSRKPDRPGPSTSPSFIPTTGSCPPVRP